MSKLLAMAVFSVTALSPQLGAAAYPEKPVRLIVPLPPGGGNDLVGRLIGNKLSASLKQQFVVDNQAGAGGTIGAEIVAKSNPDGYTLLFAGVASHGVSPNLYPKIGYDPIKDFAPISLIATVPLVLVVHPSLPVTSVKGLIALAKAKPGELNFASLGIGSSSHLAAELFMMMSGIKMTHIPYNKIPPDTDLIAGHVQLIFSSILRAVPQVHTGRLRALAVTTAKRSAILPDTPTVMESGVPGYETGSWYGILAPAQTPQAVIATLHNEIVKAVRLPDIQSQFTKDGANSVASSPEEFAAHIQKELTRWSQVIKKSGIHAE